MFSVLDRPTRLCDGISRRELLRIGGLGALGLSLPRLLSATEGPPPGIIDDPTFGRAKNVIYVWLQGGPPQHETFDPKPHAPVEIRGPFKPIQTNISGTHFCELLPRTARIADKLAVVRSLSTDNNIHSASGYEVLTGYKYVGPNARTITPQDWPYFGSLVKMLKPSEKLPPLTTAWIPNIMRLNENVTPAGQTAGFLGRQWDPDRFIGDPSDPDYQVEGLNLTDISPLRLQQRISLLEQLERHFDQVERDRAVGIYDQFQAQAFDLLITNRVRKAFDLEQERSQLRDRYGRNEWGQCLILARRLIEVGVRLVHVNWCREPGDSAVDNPMWDTHAQNADRLEDVLCPIFDVGFTALIEDLEQRGMLDETLVVLVGEFGRTPKINAQGGRDHWGYVFSFALAGAGVAAGQVFGASDKEGAYPARDRITSGDLTATLFHLLGIHHEGTFHDAQRREHRLTEGTPIRGILGTGPATFEPATPTGDLARLPPYNDDLLLNTDFSALLPLYPTNFGSRPKGWRATPRIDESPSAFGVKRLVADASTGKGRIALGFGLPDDTAGLSIPQGAQALLAQEMRNPRAGTFTFRVEACATAESKELYEDVFRKHFTCRLIIYRYAEESKDPTQRHDLATLEFTPPLSSDESPAFASFELKKSLDSPGPGQNFSIGRGLGVAVLVEKTSGQTLELPAESRVPRAALLIDRAVLNFDSRTINDEIVV